MTKKLTTQQDKFAGLVADGLTLSDAYRGSYKTSNSTSKSINELASRMMANINISSRVDELKAKLEVKQLWSREKSIEALAAIAVEAKGQPPHVIAAIKELNVMHGYNEPTKIDLSSHDGTMTPAPTVIMFAAQEGDAEDD